MEKNKKLIAGLVFMLIFVTNTQAQEEGHKFTAGVDLYSNYVFRGTRFGTGPAVQPSVKFVSGGLTAGVWGSFDAAGYAEADPYVSYAFPFGLSLGVTDYYYPGQELFDVSEATGSHAFEVNSGFSKGGFSLSANYIINKSGGAASAGGDLYFQAGYTVSNVNIFAGAGDGWHTSDGEFNLCNIGIGTSKTITVTDSFSIPVSGLVIVNPEREQLFVVVGVSF
ncbi:MAG TPA: TorF family putative porin [Bacteroidales bacterium]|nr:TorF family putative porin [Bacteroidales bacterium]